MPLVRIEVIEGRPVAERKRLLEGVHAALVEALAIPDDVSIVLHEPSMENSGIQGGKSADEVHLGFRIDV